MRMGNLDHRVELKSHDETTRALHAAPAPIKAGKSGETRRNPGGAPVGTMGRAFEEKRPGVDVMTQTRTQTSRSGAKPALRNIGYPDSGQKARNSTRETGPATRPLHLAANLTPGPGPPIVPARNRGKSARWTSSGSSKAGQTESPLVKIHSQACKTQRHQATASTPTARSKLQEIPMLRQRRTSATSPLKLRIRSTTLRGTTATSLIRRPKPESDTTPG